MHPLHQRPGMNPQLGCGSLSLSLSSSSCIYLILLEPRTNPRRVSPKVAREGLQYGTLRLVEMVGFVYSKWRAVGSGLSGHGVLWAARLKTGG